MNQSKEILATLKAAKQVIVSSHKSPDGDSVGSSLAMYHWLLNQQINAVVIHTDRAPEYISWTPKYNEIIIFDESRSKVEEVVQQSDVLLCLDYNDPSRVGNDLAAVYQTFKGTVLMIDHHLFPADFYQFAYSDTSASSTAELILRWMNEVGQSNQLTQDIATCLYLGIMTDTGSFRFPSVRAQLHRDVAQLLDTGIQHSEIHEKVFDTNTIDRMRLRGYCLSEKLVILEDLHVGYASMTEDELNRFHYQKGDTEGLVNQILSIKGVNMAVFFSEKDGLIKISFRSKGEFKVNEMARMHFDGGGHMYASGGASSESMENTISKFVTVVKDFVPQA